MVCSETAMQFLICEVYFLLVLSFKQTAFLNTSSADVVTYLFSPLTWHYYRNNTVTLPYRVGCLLKSSS